MYQIVNEFETEIDGIVNECLTKLEDKRDRLRAALEKIESTIESINAEKNKSSPIIKPIANPTMSNSENANLQNASGTDLFMWGFNRIGNEATVDQIYSEVSKLNIDSIQERVANNTLRQLLLVSANTLLKKNVLKKDERKRGAVFSKV